MNEGRRVTIVEKDVEGPLHLLEEHDRKLLIGEDEGTYEGRLRSIDIMANSCGQPGLAKFKDNLAELFPHKEISKRCIVRKSYTVNCRLMIQQERQLKNGAIILSYNIYVLLFQKFLLRFHHQNVTDRAVRDMIGTVRVFKDEYRKGTRYDVQINFLMQKIPPTFTVDIRSASTCDDKGITQARAEVFVNGALEHRSVCGRQYPTMALFATQGEVLRFLGERFHEYK